LSGLALPVVFHSTQLQGWVFYFMQFDTLVVDFAGGSYLFWAGGVACLWSAIIAGPRRGRFDQEVDQDQFFPQECFRSIQGSLFLLIGFLAVNSIAYGNNSVEQLALITVNTVLGAMAGGFVSFILATMSHGHENGMVDLVKWFFHSCCCTGHPGPKVMKHGVQVDFVRTTNGMLAGLACVAAGCGNVVPFVAAIVGALGAFIYHVTSSVLKCFKIDDPLDFYAIFGATGFWGVIFAVLFDMAEGFSHFNGFKTYEIQGPAANNPDPNKANVGNALLVNLVSLLFIGLWMGTFSIITTAALKFFGQLRLEEDEEDLGFDAHHDFDSVFKEGKGPKAEEA
jgi:Amt family ammonium transporter